MHGNMVFSTHYILGTPQQSGGFLVCSVQVLFMAAILKFKMAAIEPVQKNGTKANFVPPGYSFAP